MTNEFDVLGFNPADLTVFKEQTETQGPSNIYRPRPKDSKSDDGIYRSTIKVIYNPYDRNDSIAEIQTYNMSDANGFFSVVSSLTNNDKSCPIFKAWSKYRFSNDPAEQKIALSEAKGGPGYFDKRYSYWSIIQVMEDDNNPDLVGKYLLWKMPKVICDMIKARMKPSDPKKSSIPVMDYMFGRAIELEITPGPDDPKAPERKTREISYSTSTLSDETSCVTEPDGTSMLTDAEQDVLDKYVMAMNKVWKSKSQDERNTLMAAINTDPNTLKLREIYTRVMDKVKEYAPNLREEVGYHPWDAKTTERVEAYLKVIAEGKNPKQGINTAIAAFEANDEGVVNNVETVANTQVTSVTPTPAASSVSADDDLPF